MDHNRSVSGDASRVALPGYQLFDRLGEGTYGTVYRARQTSTGQDVAVKLLRSATRDSPSHQRSARFVRETELCAQLRHPHIVRLIDRGVTNDAQEFAVFEYVEGQTLQDLLEQNGPLPSTLLKILMEQILEALAHAHQRGIVHRDLKPANIMVHIDRDQANAKILDFGMGAYLPEALVDSQTLTLATDTLGTPSYAAPEQLRGEPTSAKADLYAWGLVFLEGLTGKRVMGGASVSETIHRQLLSEEIPLPAGIAAHPVASLLRRVLAKRPQERMGDASRLLAEFRKIHLGDLVGKLSDESPAPGRMYEAPPTQEGLSPNREYRSLVVVAINLGSTPQNQRTDEWERVEQALRERKIWCRDAGTRYGGYFAGSFSDTQLFYFGYPGANGQEARLAARFILDASDNICRHNQAPRTVRCPPIEFRASLHSGMVALEPGEIPSGCTVSMALRMAYGAQEGQVLVSPSVRERLERHMSTRPLDPSPDGSRTLQNHLLVGEREASTGRSESSPPLVGRKAESARLAQAWWDARAGKGSSVFVSGEAGLGKSALVDAFLTTVGDPLARIVSVRCLPEHKNTALLPVFALLRDLCGLRSGTPTEESSDWKRALDQVGQGTPEIHSAFGRWLSLSMGSATDAPPENPSREREILFGGLESLWRSRTSQPRIVVVEDIHWADPTSLEFLARLSGSWGNTSHLLVATARTEFDPAIAGPWGAQILLEGLSEAECVQFLTQLHGGKGLTDRLKRHLVERSGGSPLHLEALANVVSEGYSGDSRAPDAARMESILEGIPDGLMDLLAEQIRRQGEASDTAQLGAVAGQQWPYSLIAAASTLDPASLRTDLDALVQAGILVVRRGMEESIYSFRHALVRDAAYVSLPISRRTLFHARLADVLERTADSVEYDHELRLAEHLAGAQRFDEAIPAGTRAASRLLKRSNFLESLQLCLRVLDWMDQSSGGDPAESKLEVHAILTQALMGIRGWADPMVKQQIDHSRRLLDQARESPHYAPTLCALMTYHYVASNRKELHCIAQELGLHADQCGDVGLQIAARTFQGLWAHGAGRYLEAEGEFSFVLEHYRSELHGDHGQRFGLDTRVWSAATLALVKWFACNPAEAFLLADDAVRWAREIPHTPSIGIALLYKANLQQYADDRKGARTTVSELLQLSQDNGLAGFVAYGQILDAWLREDAQAAQGVIEALERMGCTAALTYYRSLVADIHARLGRYDLAIATLETCLRQCESHDESYYLAPLLLLHGTYILQGALPDRPRARGSLRKAMEIAAEGGLAWVEQDAQGLLNRMGNTGATRPGEFLL